MWNDTENFKILIELCVRLVNRLNSLTIYLRIRNHEKAMLLLEFGLAKKYILNKGIDWRDWHRNFKLNLNLKRCLLSTLQRYDINLHLINM